MRAHLRASWLRVSTRPSPAPPRWRSLENSPLFPSLTCLISFVTGQSLSSTVLDTIYTHTSPKGSVWFMPFVRVWVCLKEIMVLLRWECGAFLNWCLFLTCALHSLENHTSKPWKISSPAVSTRGSCRWGLDRHRASKFLRKPKKKKKRGENIKSEAASCLCFVWGLLSKKCNAELTRGCIVLKSTISAEKNFHQ